MTVENTEQGNVVNMNGDKMNAGIAPIPTTPASQPDEVQPATTYTAPPSSPAVADANAPTKGGNLNYVQPQQAQQPHPVSRIFDGILRNLSGPITVTDPVSGERRDVPQTRGMMGKSILAAALSGLMSGPHYRDTPYGPARDSAADIAGGLESWQRVSREAARECSEVYE